MILRDPNGSVRDASRLRRTRHAHRRTLDHAIRSHGRRKYPFASDGIRLASVLCVIGLASFIYWELHMTDVPIVDLSSSRIAESRRFPARACTRRGRVRLDVCPSAARTRTARLHADAKRPAIYPPRDSDCGADSACGSASGGIDARWVLGAGFLLMAWGLWLQVGVTTSTSGFWSFALSLATVGAPSALLFVPLSIAVLGNTTPSEGPKAAAMVNLGVQLGGSIAVATRRGCGSSREHALADTRGIPERRQATRSRLLPTRRIARPVDQYRALSIGRTRLCRRDVRHSTHRAFLHFAGVLMRGPRPQQ
jgi:hypothetical protein